MHNQVAVGSELTISTPNNQFALDADGGDLDRAILHPAHRDLDIGRGRAHFDIARLDRDGAVAALVEIDHAERHKGDDDHDQQDNDEQDSAQHGHPRGVGRFIRQNERMRFWLPERNDRDAPRRLTNPAAPSICAGFSGALRALIQEEIEMSRICELTGKGRQVGHNVSHANNKTKRTFLPNLQNVTLISDSLGRQVKLRVSTAGLRSVEHVGGLDNWLTKTSDEKLSLRARRLKREIAKKQTEAQAA